MSVATELTKLNTNIKNAYDEIATKGGTIPQNKNTDNLATAINSIPSGGGADEYFVVNTQTSYSDVKSFIKKFPSINTTSSYLSQFFQNCNELIETGDIYAPNCTSVNQMFGNCTNLEKIGNLTFGNITSVSNMFNGCSKLKSIPQFNTQNVTSFMTFCFNCSSLEDFPVLNWASMTSITSAFWGTKKLTDQSLDNILQCCISATSYTGTKNLSSIGFTSSNHQKIRIQACPHYQDFLDAGWTIGY